MTMHCMEVNGVGRGSGNMHTNWDWSHQPNYDLKSIAISILDINDLKHRLQ